MLDSFAPLIKIAEEIWQHHRWIYFTVAGYAVFSAFTSALPSPEATNDKKYRVLYNFCHILSLNIAKVVPFLRLPERK